MTTTNAYAVASTLWDPLKNGRFRTLWLANVFSNLGTWMQGMGATWLMVQISSSSQMVALVQTAMTLPIFLLVIPAGIIADKYDRPTFLLLTHTAMGLAALGLSILVTFDIATPETLLFGTFLIGCGAAMTMPAWQAAMSTLVEPHELHSAAALNGMSFNFARAVGPAIAGFIAQAAALSMIFWINAISYLGLIIVFRRWSKTSTRSSRRECAENIPSSTASFRHFLSDIRFRALLLRTFVCFFAASSMWSLLPAFAGIELRMQASEVGLLLGTIGFGAVLGGVFVPTLKDSIGINRLTLFAPALLGFALILVSWKGETYWIWISMLLTGLGWAFVVSGLNGSAQGMFPKGLRARAISVYLMVMYGATSAGSALWGAVSAHWGLGTAFLVSGAMLTISIGILLRWSIE